MNGATAFVTDQSVYPFPAWPLNPLANWISPHANYDGPTDAGDTTFIFATTFTLPSNFLTAAIVMRLAADNGIEDVKLNGTSLALTTAMRLLPGNTATRAVIAEARGFQDGLGAPISFNHTHGIVAGLNTLEFHVRNSRTDDMNQQNPTGLLAAFESDFSVPPGTSELPEPSTMGLMGAGLGRQ